VSRKFTAMRQYAIIFNKTADNDLAVGMLIDHLSKSPVWKEYVVFILEDDALMHVVVKLTCICVHLVSITN